MTTLADVVMWLDAELRSGSVPDYDAAFNGLQLANSGVVTRVAAAVDFSANTVSGALREKADLLIVHHGMFWRGTHPFVGTAYDRLRDAISGGLAVYSSHIPLDLHAEMGNNVLLAKELELQADSTFGQFRGVEIGISGTTDLLTSQIVERASAFSSRFETTLVATPFPGGHRTRRWAIITGAGANSSTLGEARRRGVDTLIVGEGTHHTAVEAMELGLVVLYGGHYATETLGVRALSEHVARRFGLSSTFVNVPTGL
ncbi:MAG TPA: Nif3-like dinuclear metal center hexameric protein [Gemmatimonadaceae bacterium]